MEEITDKKLNSQNTISSENYKFVAGIVGYGNLGKSVAKELLNDIRCTKCYIFSRRPAYSFKTDALLTSNSKFVIESYNNIMNYKEKIDFLVLCVGSQNDLVDTAISLIDSFNIIDTYDNHMNISNYINKLKDACQASQKIALCCFGWDPGLLSLYRLLMSSLNGKENTLSLWGRGLSYGHSQALREIEGVKNAIQITIPKKIFSLKQIKTLCKKSSIKNHYRKCYISLVNDTKIERKRVEKEIRNIEGYFKGGNVKVRFVKEKRILKLNCNQQHCGKVFSVNANNSIILVNQVKTMSNALLTTKCVMLGVNALINLHLRNESGVKTIYDIPPAYYLDKNLDLL